MSWRYFMDRQIANKLAGLLVPMIVATGIDLAIIGTIEARDIKNTTRTSVNRNVNRNTNVNVNRHVDVDVDVDRRHYHPVARAAATTAAVTTAAVVTSAVVGSMVRTLPPACSAVVVNGLTYQNCGGAWYQPQYAGTSVTYVVVNPPQ
jgi:hypothetical protein